MANKKDINFFVVDPECYLAPKGFHTLEEAKGYIEKGLNGGPLDDILLITAEANSPLIVHELQWELRVKVSKDA